MQYCKDAACTRDNRVLTAVMYCVCLGVLGLDIASLGPALIQLAVKTNSTLTAVGYTFFFRSLAYMLASFLGPLYDKFPNPHFVLAAGVAIAGVGTMAVPLSTSVYLLGFIVMSQGIGMAVCDVGCNVLLIYLWGSDVGPWMQLMHFCFGVGAFCAPLLMRLVEAIVLDGRDEGSVLDAIGTYDSAFYIMGAANIIVAAGVTLLRAPKRRDGAHGTHASAAESGGSTAASRELETKGLRTGADIVVVDDTPLGGTQPVALGTAAPVSATSATSAVNPLAVEEEPGEQGLPVEHPGISQPSSTPGSITAQAAAAASSSSAAPAAAPDPLVREMWVVTGIIAGLLFLYVGMETGYGAFITSYAVVYLGRSEEEAQFLTSGYWGAIMLGRLAAIPLSLVVKPWVNLGATMGGCVLATVVLIAGQASVGAVWAGSVLFGLCMASVFPLAISVAESFYPVEGKHGTVFVIGAATGEMLLPFIVSSLFGPGLSRVEEEAGVGGVGVPHGSSGAVPEAPGSPVVLMWLMGVAGVLNMGVWWLAVRRGRALKAALTKQAASKAAAEAAVVVAATQGAPELRSAGKDATVTV